MGTVLRAVAMAACTVLFWAWADILIWQRIFETDRLWQYDSRYHAGWFVMLVGLLAVGSLGLLNRPRLAVWYAASSFVLSTSGLEDALYYWLDGKPLPTRLPWLDVQHPLILHPVTSGSLLISVGFWLAISSLGLLLATGTFRDNQRESGPPNGPRHPSVAPGRWVFVEETVPPHG